MANAYTVWVAHGRIGTYRTREKAEQVQAEVIANIEQLTRIQEWTPQEYEQPFVTFNDEDELISN
jgi:Tfp pilus assembly protein PilP